MPEQRVAPGAALGLSSDLAAGAGTFVWGDQIHASVAGECTVDRGQISISSRAGKQAVLPQVGDTVLCRVTRLAPRSAAMDILCVGGAAMAEPCPGLLRREDVRSYELEGVEMYRVCRPGDLVQARVLALGDSRAYVTTAADALGVVFATSAEGEPLTPLAWDTMVCVKSGLREPRKVALLSREQQPPSADPAEPPRTG